jgi:HlyD family secretion protein
VVTYDVVLDVENPELKLRPGMTAKVTFVVAERRSVLRVPAAALRFRPSAAPAAGAAPGVTLAAADGAAVPAAGVRTLWVVEGARLRPVPVRVGVTDGTRTEIVGDLPAGARVALREQGTSGAGTAGAKGAGASSSQRAAPPGPPRMF